MSLRRRRVMHQLRPGPRPQPPAGLLERLKEEIPEEFSSTRSSGRGTPRRPAILLPWTLAASIVLVVFSGVLALRFFEQAPRQPMELTTVGEEYRQATRDGDQIPSADEKAIEPREVALFGETASEDRRELLSEIVPRRSDLAPPQERPARRKRASLPSEEGVSGSGPISRSMEEGVLQPEELHDGYLPEAPAPAARADEARRTAAGRAVDVSAAKAAPRAADETEEREAAGADLGDLPPLRLDTLRWGEDGTLHIGGRAAVDGVVEVRLLGTDRTESLRVEAGRSFELLLEELGGARRLEIGLLGWEGRLVRDLPEP